MKPEAYFQKEWIDSLLDYIPDVHIVNIPDDSKKNYKFGKVVASPKPYDLGCVIKGKFFAMELKYACGKSWNMSRLTESERAGLESAYKSGANTMICVKFQHRDKNGFKEKVIVVPYFGIEIYNTPKVTLEDQDLRLFTIPLERKGSSLWDLTNLFYSFSEEAARIAYEYDERREELARKILLGDSDSETLREFMEYVGVASSKQFKRSYY